MKTFDLDNFEVAARIVVIGVGGGGNNAVNRMISESTDDKVEYYVANTDKQALASSKCPNRIILGESITEGLGAGGEPEMGEKAAESSINDIKEIVNGANMVFIAAGMGGGTGTGASPVIARIAKDAGALVVAVVTRPFSFEGKQRTKYSIEGLNKLRKIVDSIIVVSNDKLLLMNGNQTVGNAFSLADGVLTQSVKTIVNLILLPSIINLDFADVRATLKDSGVALIGYGMGSGPDKAKEAATSALDSPLLESSIKGARRAIVSVTCGVNVSLTDARAAVSYLVGDAGNNIDIKFGIDVNSQLNDEILLSFIASDFENEIEFDDNYQNLQPTQVTPLLKNEDNQNPSEVKQEENKDNLEINETDFLPDFLKNIND